MGIVPLFYFKADRLGTFIPFKCKGISVSIFYFVKEVNYVTNDEKKSWAEELLRQKHKELGRLPRKDDFDEPTRSRIKAFLGPWPRALEAAGLKEPRPIAPKSAKRKKSATKSKKQAISAHQKSERRRAKQEESKSSTSDTTK